MQSVSMRGLTPSLHTFLVLLPLLTGCAAAQLHTARTTPVGENDVTIGLGYLDNRLDEERGERSIENYPLQIAYRTGVDERVDVGVRTLLGDGLLADGRYGFMEPASPLQVSLGLGVGFGGWWMQEGAVSLTVPVVAMASYDIGDLVTPYVGVGWAFWWHLGRSPEEGDPDADYAARAGHGDGVVTALVGVAFHVTPTLHFLVEYDFSTQVLDDPGDFFSMVDTHVVSGAVTF
ncbi:MAG: hypothetical protein EP329_09055 [Deltaproteobacteria bacterium]|nr:MAG: hypothetical protein EP329_09055 [Deltaproteobacteria bacterium]